MGLFDNKKTNKGQPAPIPIGLPSGSITVPVPDSATMSVKLCYDAHGNAYENIEHFPATSYILMANGVMLETPTGERFFAPTGAVLMTVDTLASSRLGRRSGLGYEMPPPYKEPPKILTNAEVASLVKGGGIAAGVASGASPSAPSKTYTKGTTTMPNVKKPSDIDCWTLAEAVAQVSTRLLLYGPPGTGKSYGAARMGLKAGQEPVIITCTEDMSAIQLIGHFIPKNNEMVWMDGPIIKAWRSGARLVINEIDRASGDALTFFLGALDDPATASMTLPNDTHEMVRPKRGFTVVATMNGEPDTDLPAPLRDRFASTININQVHPAAIAALPPDLQHAAKTSALVEDEARRISVRKWNEFAYLRDAFVQKHGEEMGVAMAAASVFGVRANEALNAIRINKVGA